MMKNFFNYLNVSVGIIAGICTIILFLKDVFFKPSDNITDVASTTAYKEPDTIINSSNTSSINTVLPQAATKSSSQSKKTKASNKIDSQNLTDTNKKILADLNTDTINKKKLSVWNTSALHPDRKSVFWVTFIKTPVAFYLFFLSLFACFFVVIYQFFQNVFTKFEHGFETTYNICDWGWNDVLLGWWWNNGVLWHLAISVIVWGVIFTWIHRQK